MIRQKQNNEVKTVKKNKSVSVIISKINVYCSIARRMVESVMQC